MSLQLSQDFYLHEFTRSSIAARRGISLDNPPPNIIANLARLCSSILQPLRDSILRGINVNSGWRPQWLNVLVGGSKSSEHIDGRAADINAIGFTPMELCLHAAGMHLPFNQLILEFDQWMHISVAPANMTPKLTILTARIVNGKVQYLSGLVRKE